MKKIGKYLLIILLCLTFTITGVQAKSYIKDLFQAGEKIKINEKLDGTAFLAGTKVIINETINGIGFIAGEEVEINGNQEYIITAGYEMDLNTNIKNDLFLYGEEVKINESTIGRDAYIGGTTVTINGTIDRNAYIYGTSVELKGTINGNVTINAIEIKIDENAKILGTLKYNEDAIINGLNDTIKTKTYKTTNNFSFTDYLTTFITSYIHITLLALVLVYLFEKTIKNILKQVKDSKSIVNLLGKGFLILIGVPIIGVTLLMTGLLMSIGVVGLIIYGLLVYISEIITAYALAHYIDKKYIKKNLNNYVLIIIGLFIIRIISIIPIIGGFISFISILLGLGIIGNMILEAKK